MIIKNTTIQNKSKLGRLNSEHIIPTHAIGDNEVVKFLEYLGSLEYSKESILFSTGIQLLNGNKNSAVKKLLASYEIEIVPIIGVPMNEFDLLGSAYQYLNSKKENLELGSFYTGPKVATEFVSDLKFDKDQVIFDPACGSGAFLFGSDAKPEQIYGVDFDPIAVMIAKFNYFIKFPNAKSPNIYRSDFFDWFQENSKLRFDYIIGNPPYGASLDRSKIPSNWVTSGESFSYFIEFSFQLLKNDGILRFLLPEAVLNVKRHADIRLFMLQSCDLKRIKRFNSKFTGVMSDVFMLEIESGTSQTVIFEDVEKTVVKKSLYLGMQNYVFANLSKEDISIVEKVESLGSLSLSDSVFGLGVVTGDNKTKLFDCPQPDMEHIYTGKEVEKYVLEKPRNYIKFDRNLLQQVAPDEIYRTSQKLIYKTINKKLKVALDTTSSLSSNSANIIIPQIEGYDIRTVLGFLNSKLYSYLHFKLFGGVNKIAKENLMALPFPRLSNLQNQEIIELVASAIENHDDSELQEYINFSIFKLDKDEVFHINKTYDSI